MRPDPAAGTVDVGGRVAYVEARRLSMADAAGTARLGRHRRRARRRSARPRPTGSAARSATASWASSGSSSITSTAPRPTTAGSSGSPTTGPTTSASPSAPTRRWAEVEREAGERIVTVTGGLDLWPADPAIPMADYTDSLTAEGVPFELLDARRDHAALAAVAPRRRRPRTVAGRRAAWPTRSAATPRTGAWPGRTARPCATGRP